MLVHEDFGRESGKTYRFTKAFLFSRSASEGSGGPSMTPSVVVLGLTQSSSALGERSGSCNNVAISSAEKPECSKTSRGSGDLKALADAPRSKTAVLAQDRTRVENFMTG